MSVEQIKLIKATEDKADEMRKKGNLHARELVSNAHKEAEHMIQLATQNSEIDYLAIISKAEQEATEAYDQLMVNARDECSNILAVADGNLTNAVSIIVKGVVT